LTRRRVAFLVLVFAFVAISSGCIEQKAASETEATVEIGGGTFQFSEGAVRLEFPEGAVKNQTLVTVNRLDSPPKNNSVVVLTAFRFGPEGTRFSKPVTVSIRYDPAALPSGVKAADLRLITRSGGSWREVPGSSSDVATSQVTGDVTHFSIIGVGKIGADKSGTEQQQTEQEENEKEENEKEENEEEENEQEQDTSIIFQFEVPVGVLEREYRLGEGESLAHTTYLCKPYFAWKPVPFVRYYEIKIHFNGNPPKVFKGWNCFWRKRHEAYCTEGPCLWEEETTYYLAPQEFCRNYRGRYDSEELGGKHGHVLFVIQDQFYDGEGLSTAQVNDVKNEIRAFVEDYVRGWTASVRAVCAQSNQTSS